MTELEALLRAAPPVAPERLRERVRALRPRSQRRHGRALVLALAALVVAAVGAAFLHGLRSPKPLAAQAHQASAPEQTLRAPGSAGAAPTGRGFATPGARLIQEVASLRLRVDRDRLAGATARATRIVRALGGYAASVEYETPQGRPGEAFLELRVPTVRVQDALARLGGLGTLLSQRISTRDLQNQLERQTAQIGQLQEQIKLTLAALRDPSLSPVDRIRLQLKLNEAKRALNQRLHARKGTIATGTLAHVSLVLTAAKAAGAIHHPGRLHRLLGSAGSFLALEATVVLYALIVLAPVGLLALGVWGALRARRRRDERQLLGAA